MRMRMEACPQMLTYHNVRSALGQDIRNSLAKFPSFNDLELIKGGGEISRL